MRKSELELFSNGMIIKKADNKFNQYMGVEGDNWFIDLDIKGIEKKELEYLHSYYCENIDRSWANNEFIDCCADIDYINRYVAVCKEANIDFIVLFCETQNKYPKWQLTNTPNEFNFLGYDYAYAGGSFYSCVQSDVISRRIPELFSIKLNEYGLIQTEEEITRFIQLRERLKSILPSYTFEEGNFIIYKLWKYVGIVPIESGK